MTEALSVDAASEIQWSEDYFGGAWLVTRYADVERALRDSRLSVRRTGGWVPAGAKTDGSLKPFRSLVARALLFLDAPDHGRLRSLMMGAFQPHALQELGQRLREQVRVRLDGIDASAPFDFIARVAQPVPAQVVAEMLGLTLEAADSALRHATDIAAFVEHPCPDEALTQRAQRSALGMAQLWRGWLEEDPPPHDPNSLFGRLLAAHREGRIESREELLAQLVMLLFAGHETTRHLLGSALDALMADPLMRERAAADPAVMRRAVREVLRHASPVRYTARRVAVPFEWHGQQLRRGDAVLLMLAEANRDAVRFTAPDQLNLTRDEGVHLAFGVGPHVCIGAALTQLEVEIVLTEVLQRWPDLQRAAPGGEVPASEPIRSGLYQGWRSLWVHRG
jgi:cytochrome P450